MDFESVTERLIDLTTVRKEVPSTIYNMKEQETASLLRELANIKPEEKKLPQSINKSKEIIEKKDKNTEKEYEKRATHLLNFLEILTSKSSPKQKLIDDI